MTHVNWTGFENSQRSFFALPNVETVIMTGVWCSDPPMDWPNAKSIILTNSQAQFSVKSMPKLEMFKIIDSSSCMV